MLKATWLTSPRIAGENWEGLRDIRVLGGVSQSSPRPTVFTRPIARPDRRDRAPSLLIPRPDALRVITGSRSDDSYKILTDRLVSSQCFGEFESHISTAVVIPT